MPDYADGMRDLPEDRRLAILAVCASEWQAMLADAVVETHDQPGGGPPPHIHHREDETFQILEGEYEFSVAGKTIRACQGDTLFAPRDIPHTYRYVGKTPGRLLTVITPAGFEGFFEEIGALSPQQIHAIGLREVERERPLVAVDRRIAPRQPRRRAAPPGSSKRPRPRGVCPFLSPQPGRCGSA